MPTSVYFNNQNATREQWLLEDLIIESIRNHGIDVYYLPRASQSTLDTLFGDDPVKYYNQAIKIDMYLETFQDYEGNKEFFSKFGLQIDESARVAVARRTFERLMGKDLRNVPKEGDLIYLPIQMKLMEIRFVEEERNFFQLGRNSKNPYMYVLNIETFKYNGELLDTGIEEIDDMANRLAQSVNYTMTANASSASYQTNEIVYQGSSLETATAKAVVAGFDVTTNTLRLRNVMGEFDANAAIKGATSNAYFVLTSYNLQQEATQNAFGENYFFQTNGDDILDFTEKNPFGAP
jgi:hypothetical protein